MKRAFVVVLALAAGLPFGASAALKRWGPTWSEVTGLLADQTQLHLTMAVVHRIDGKFEGDKIVKLEPGRHTIVLQSPTRKGVPGTDQTVELDVEPCKRYYFNAQFKAAMGDEWKPVVTRVETIAGCKLPAAK